MAESNQENGYNIQVYTDYGIFQYEVQTVKSAMEHGHQIMKDQVYRHETKSGDVEFLHAYKVKVSGERLASQYKDSFVRT